MRILRILSHLNSKRSHNPQQKRADVDVTRFGDQPNIDREYLSRMSRDVLDYEGQQVVGGGFRILDLFCAAGGAGMGYNQAGFEVVGVDVNRQPHYPFEFIQADAMTLDPAFLASFDAIHASPPCQAYTRKTTTWGRERKHWIEHPDLLAPTRAMLVGSGLPFVIENVEGAPLRSDLVLCGTMFGLPLIKHRCFELSFPLFALLPSCNHAGVYNPWSGKGRTADKLREAQGTPWIPTSGGASRKAGVTGDLFNAIPPAYTKFIGERLTAHLRNSERRAA